MRTAGDPLIADLPKRLPDAGPFQQLMDELHPIALAVGYSSASPAFVLRTTPPHFALDTRIN